MENNATNATNAPALTPEQLATLPPEIAALVAAQQQQLAATQAALLAAQARKTRTPKAPVDPWSNAQLLVYGNDHSKAMCALALLLRSGVDESAITQQDWTRATLALIIATRAYRPEGKLACAEASTRTACGQARRWREIVDIAKLEEKTKRIQLDAFERAIFDYYKNRSLWPGKKDDSDKKMSVMAADLLREEWRKHWTENPDWRPCKEEQPEDNDNDNDNGDDNGDN